MIGCSRWRRHPNSYGQFPSIGASVAMWSAVLSPAKLCFTTLRATTEIEQHPGALCRSFTGFSSLPWPIWLGLRGASFLCAPQASSFSRLLCRLCCQGPPPSDSFWSSRYLYHLLPVSYTQGYVSQ